MYEIIFCMKFKIFVILVFFCFLFTSTALAADDPYYIKQWYLKTIKADESWQTTRGTPNIIVAVIDTGVDLDHPELQGNIWTNSREIAGDRKDNDNNGYIDDIHGWNFVSNSADTEPDILLGYSKTSVNHGTFVAGIIAAISDNNIGIKGVASNVKIMPLLALNSVGNGNSSAVSSAIDYAVKNGANIINLSFAGSEYSDTLKKSIINAYDKGVLIVAAAGNSENMDLAGADMSANPLYPVCYDRDSSVNRILGVVSTNKKNQISTFTNYGADCIDIGAPGEEMISSVYQNTNYLDFRNLIEENWNGSSFAAALVSGGAALLKSVDPTLSPAQIIKLITDESGLMFLQDPKYENKAGSGLLNIKKAIDKVKVSTSVPALPAEQSSPEAEPIVSTSELLVSKAASGTGTIKILNSQFQTIKELQVFSGDKFHGLNFQLADVNNDGVSEIVSGAVAGDQPFVRVIDFQGKIISSFLAYDINFRGGVNVSAGDVDSDGKVEIVVAPESKSDPTIKIFNQNGQLEREFLAFNKDFKNGINIAVGDVDGDKKDDIVAGPKSGLLPKIKIFDEKGNLKNSFIAFSASVLSGANVAISDLNNDGKKDILAGAGAGSRSYVNGYDYNGKKLFGFEAYNSKFLGGVKVAARDWDGNGKIDIITAAGKGGGPHVKMFNTDGTMISQIFPWPNGFTAGINIAVK